MITTLVPTPSAHLPGLLARLQGLRGPDQHGWFTALCPFHLDRKHPNLRISTVGFCCMACGEKGALATLVRRLDGPIRGQTFAERIAATYDYQDANACLLYQVVRLRDPKDFRQRRPDGGGGWIWNLQGVAPVLYRLPELLRADPAQPVFVAEGEKDVDALIKLGLVATTNPGGAGKWRSSYDRWLHNRTVVILPDNDAVGMNHAQEVARCLHPH